MPETSVIVGPWLRETEAIHGELGASDTAIRRRLTEIEYANWCFGQPYNIAVVVHLAGVVTAEEVRAAVAGLQRRHPLLGVTTVVAEDGTPWLESAGVGPVPVRVVELSGPRRLRCCWTSR